MKANLYLKLTVLLLLIGTTHLPAFSSNHIKEIFANSNFQITEHTEVIDISMNKNPWESFTLAIDNVEVLNNPIVNIDILSNEDIDLRVDISDGLNMSSKSGIIKESVNGKSAFQTISFDFSNLISDLDFSGDVYLVFYVNPGKSYNGSIAVKNISFSLETSNDNTNPTQTPEGFKMFPSPATTFTNVEIPNANFNTLKIIDMGGRTVADFDVSFYSGNTYRIELNNLPKGYYTVQLTDNETVLAEKLIIN